MTVTTFGDFYKFYDHVVRLVARHGPPEGFMTQFIKGYQEVLRAECAERRIAEHQFYQLAHDEPNTPLCAKALEEAEKLVRSMKPHDRELYHEWRTAVGL